MKLVIEIPEDVLKRTVFYREFRELNDCITTIKALEKAIPLPEHHGRIIDESKINKVFYNTEEVIYNNIKAINTTITHTDAPTIIEGSDSE